MSSNPRMILAKINRWWLDPKKIWEDIHIKKFESSTVKWKPHLFSKADIVDGVYTLRGPRQVGKTTLLKLFIRELLENGFESSSIVYVPCDIFERYDQLLDILLDIRGRTSGKLVLILDEVTFVDDWQRAIKVFVDGGFLENTTIIACGSHAVDVKKGASYLVGRRGNARHPIDRIMLTMSFREYVEILEPDIAKNIETIDDIVSMNPLKRETLIAKLYDLFIKYLKTGGYPRVIDEYNKEKKISKATVSDFINYLSRDITRLGKSETTARAILASIIKQKCNPTSWNSIAREIGISQPTVQDYIDILSKMYIIRPIYHPNRTFTGPNEKRDKKIVIRDPFLYHIASIWTQGFPELDIEPEKIIIQNLEKEQQHIVEMVVLEHLARQGTLYYWKSKRELDAIVMRGNKVIGIEVKWRDNITRNIIRESLRTYSKIPLKRSHLIIATKHQYEEQDNILLIPTQLLLLAKVT